MTTTYIRISVSVMTTEVGAEGAEAEGEMAPAMLLPLTLLYNTYSNYSGVEGLNSNVMPT